MAEPAYSALFVDGYDNDDVPSDPGVGSLHWDAMHIVGMLEQACRNEHPGMCLDGALGSIANVRREPGKQGLILSEWHRDVILKAITRAKATLPHLMPDYSAGQIRAGLDAAATQVVLWSETPEQQARRHPDVARDAQDYAQMLRNDMHNMDLHERIGERARRRRDKTVGALLCSSLLLL